MPAEPADVEQLTAALGLNRGKVPARPSRLDLSLKHVRVHRDERLALADERALVEREADDAAGHLGAELDGLPREERARRRHPVLEEPLLDGRHRYGERVAASRASSRAPFRLRIVPAEQTGHEEEGDDEDADADPEGGLLTGAEGHEEREGESCVVRASLGYRASASGFAPRLGQARHLLRTARTCV